MPVWFDGPGDWLAVLTMFSIVLAGLLWIIRAEVRRTRDEFRPNGGGSLRDQVDLIVHRQGEVLADVAYLRQRLDQHVDFHHRIED